MHICKLFIVIWHAQKIAMNQLRAEPEALHKHRYHHEVSDGTDVVQCVSWGVELAEELRGVFVFEVHCIEGLRHDLRENIKSVP